MTTFVTGSRGYLGSRIFDVVDGYRYDRDKDLLTELNSCSPSVIVHCGAELHDESKMFDSNVMMTWKILEYCKDHGTRLIYIGSSSEYGKTDELMRENSRINPSSIYAATKGCAHYWHNLIRECMGLIVP